MDRDELIFQEYKLYSEQKENFIDRNFSTNKFYLATFIVTIFAIIYTNNVVFMNRISATLLFSIIGISICVLWWMNIDSYNTIIKIKYSKVIEVLEEKLPVKPFTDEFTGFQEYRSKKIFMFSDIQKIVSIIGAIFFFAIFISEITPIVLSLVNKLNEAIIN